MARWCSGDPSGFLEISDEDVVYFDPTLPGRIDGLAALAELYEACRGQIRAERYEFINPLVQEIGDAAVLTYNFVSWGGTEDALRWNCTEVFRRRGEHWKLIQTHWSITQSGVRSTGPAPA
jgi:Calcium/calmodulin dependent protein kinase II Association.